jgi:hypothetical protein
MSYDDVPDRGGAWGPNGEIFISAVDALQFHPVDSVEGKKALKEYLASEQHAEYVRIYVTGD